MSGLQPSASKAATLCTQIAVPRTQVRPVHAGCTHAPRLQPMHPGCSPMHTVCRTHARRLQPSCTQAATPCTQAADPMHPGCNPHARRLQTPCTQAATPMHAGALLRALHEHLRRADKVPSYHAHGYLVITPLSIFDELIRCSAYLSRVPTPHHAQSTPDYVPSGLCTCAIWVRVRARVRVRV